MPDAAAPREILVAENLEKVYANGTHAVRGVSFRVREGEIYGILGPNGAGKSTTIGMLGTLVRPTKGRASIDGLDVQRESMEVRRRFGFAMQEAGVDDLATGREFLILQGRLYGLAKDVAARRAVQLLKLFELTDAADRRIRTYSGGMKRRIDLAAALIHLPKVLFLDEPTEGLDPRSRRALWLTLERLNADLGTTILLSTHYMEEADRLCDRLAIIDEGRIVVEDTPERLKASVGGQSLILEYRPEDADRAARALDLLQRAEKGLVLRRSENVVHVTIADAAEAAPRLLRLLDRGGVPPASLRIQQPTLDDVYLKFTGRSLDATPEAKR